MAAEDSKGLTVERLKQLIHYDQESGVFTRLSASKKVPLGIVKSSPLKDGHTRLKVDNYPYLSHRLAWFYVHGYWPTLIDHINGNANDNRIGNLREVNHAVNMQNKRGPMKNNKSGYLGVSLKAGRYRAQISVNGLIIDLGRYDTAFQAHQVYVHAKRNLHIGCSV
jgi:hypothetical protein